MNEKLEIERKWLLIDEFNIPKDIILSKIDITQMYLLSEKKERLRISKVNGERKIHHTIKRKAEGGGNWELEREISEEEYCQLVLNVNKDCYIILKERNVFFIDNIKYELDIFIHPIKLTILEVEVEKFSQNVFLPSWLGNCIEVTHTKGFSNKRIASRPEDTIRKIDQLLQKNKEG